VLISAKLQLGKSGQKTELIGRSALRRRSVLGCSGILEKGGEEEQEQDEEEEEVG